MPPLQTQSVDGSDADGTSVKIVIHMPPPPPSTFVDVDLSESSVADSEDAAHSAEESHDQTTSTAASHTSAASSSPVCACEAIEESSVSRSCCSPESLVRSHSALEREREDSGSRASVQISFGNGRIPRRRHSFQETRRIVVEARDANVPIAPRLDAHVTFAPRSRPAHHEWTGEQRVDWRVRFASDLAASNEVDLAQLDDIPFAFGRHAHRLIARAPPQPPQPTSFSCGICLEDVIDVGVVFGQQLDATGTIIRSDKQCTHTFCDECIRAFLVHEITDGQVLQIRCPGRDAAGAPCRCIAPSSWIKTRVGGVIFEKYERFLKLKQSDSYRSCPNTACMHVQRRAVGGSKNMVCEKCATEYCFLHDLAHVSTSCREYQRQLASESVASLSHIASHTVQCPWPTCRVKCIKASGCNHMTCSQCDTEFCYLCGGFYFGGLHFSSGNIFGCPNMKNDDLPANCRRSIFRSAFRFLFGVPFFLLLVALALALFLAVEAVYLAWFVLISPTLLIWCCAGSDARDQRWYRRLGKCLFWGIHLVAAFCS